MKTRFLFSCLTVLVVFAQTSSGQSNPGPQVTAIKAGKVIDPETGKTSVNQIILVEGKKIKEIGGNVAIPAEAKIVDLSKSTVSPGLFDAHTHLCMSVIPSR